jgi:hypothetical protein
MAFHIVQTFQDVQHQYDRSGDVLYLSFGPPRPAVALQVEDWLALRLSLTPPVGFVGMTIVGFKRISEKINRYIERDIEQELPQRVKRLRSISMTYDDETDTLVMRTGEADGKGFSIFEPLAEHVYLEKSLPTKEVLGVKILNFTKSGPAAIEAMFGRIIDTIFEPGRERDENARLFTRAVVRSVDWKGLAAIAA